ncbi:MAG: aldose 1-epimerase [Ulvibacter sp.]|jgi:aldose 1-epimerase
MIYKKISSENSLLDHFHFSERFFSCKVFPNLGGSIQELIIDDINIIKGISFDDSGISDYLVKYQSAVLFPFPNRLEDGHYTFEGKPYKFPLNNSETKNAIHGFINDKPFEVVRITNNALKLEFNSDGEQAFPFNYSFGINFIFSKHHIQVQFSVENRGDRAFPFGLGWHPYFQLNSIKDNTLEFLADKAYTNTERLIPNGFEQRDKSLLQIDKASLDNAYHLVRPEIRLRTALYELQMRTPEDCYLQIYTPSDKQSIAIEPMTCIANAFNSGVGLKTLQPEEKYIWDLDLNITTKSLDKVSQ